MISIRRGQHAGSHHDLAGARTERAHPGDGMRGMAPFVPPRLEMVADEDGIEPDPLGLAGELEEFPGAELFGGCLVTEPEHCSGAFRLGRVAFTHDTAVRRATGSREI